MTLKRLVVGFIIYNTLLWQPAETAYPFRAARRMRRKIVMMDLELFLDARAKVIGIWHVRKEYSHTSPYMLAKVTYGVRRKYARMIFVYYKTMSNAKKFDQHIHLDHLREIQNLAYEIDHLIKSIEEYDDKDSRKKHIVRMGRSRLETEKPNAKALRERSERLKQRAYIERKKMLWSLNHGNNRKGMGRSQFQKRNPVDEGFESEITN